MIEPILHRCVWYKHIIGTVTRRVYLDGLGKCVKLRGCEAALEPVDGACPKFTT